MISSSSSSRPDWMIAGLPNGDGVRIVASTKLDYGELSLEPNFWENTWNEWFIHSSPTAVFSFRARQFVVIDAATYEEALKKLFGQWSPSPSYSALPSSSE
jgi:hypothetical protein